MFCFIFLQSQADASKADRDDFLSEAVILGQFNDVNVIKLEGVVYQGIMDMIIKFVICDLYLHALKIFI